MNAENFAIITAERLEVWKKILNGNNATPICLIGVGHENHLGEFHVLIPQDLPIEIARKALLGALFNLDKQAAKGGGR